MLMEFIGKKNNTINEGNSKCNQDAARNFIDDGKVVQCQTLPQFASQHHFCLLYTSDAADE